MPFFVKRFWKLTKATSIWQHYRKRKITTTNKLSRVSSSVECLVREREAVCKPDRHKGPIEENVVYS